MHKIQLVGDECIRHKTATQIKESDQQINALGKIKGHTNLCKVCILSQSTETLFLLLSCCISNQLSATVHVYIHTRVSHQVCAFLITGTHHQNCVD